MNDWLFYEDKIREVAVFHCFLDQRQNVFRLTYAVDRFNTQNLGAMFKDQDCGVTLESVWGARKSLNCWPTAN